MGYFSNSTEGDIYFAKYCENCANDDAKEGCFIWWLHLTYNGDPEYEDRLDAMIPREVPGLNGNGPCVMFREVEHL